MQRYMVIITQPLHLLLTHSVVDCVVLKRNNNQKVDDYFPCTHATKSERNIAVSQSKFLLMSVLFTFVLLYTARSHEDRSLSVYLKKKRYVSIIKRKKKD